MTLGASAYSNTGNNGTSTTSVDNNNANQLQAANLAYNSSWQGLGAYNRDAASSTATSDSSGKDFQEGQSPEHSFDNNERADSVLLSFGSSVNLTSITFGWTSVDSDFFVLAFTGVGAPTLTGQTYANLTGWTLVGNYSNQGTTAVNLASPGGTGSVVSNSGLSSSYWLIGAGGFTSGVGVNSGDKSAGGSYLALGATGSSFDYLKLTSVGVTNGGGGTGGGGGSAPEPGSLALAGAAFLGMMGMRRRKAAV
jgi:hypothetical protein